jgi:PAS domain S-box-containing protein
MRTPSLRARVVAAGVGVVVLVLIGLDLFLYLRLRADLLRNLDAVLDVRAQVVQGMGTGLQGEALADQLEALGLTATVWTAEGQSFAASPPSPGPGHDVPPSPEEDPTVEREVLLPDGGRAVVYAQRSGVDDALFDLLVLEVFGTLGATALAALLLLHVSEVALRPLTHVAAAARRTAAGQRGERLRPDRPHTRLGQMAAAYDEMLDALEAAIREARATQVRRDQLEERSRQIIETANDAFVAFDAKGLIIDWNGKAERMFGWARREVIGRRLVDTVLPPQLRQATLEGIEQFVTTGHWEVLGRHIQMSALDRDGRVFPVEVTAWATSNGGDPTFNVFVQDITNRRRAEEARYRLAAIVESSEDAIIGSDLEGRILTWNEGAERMYGYRADEVLGEPVDVIVPPERRDEVARYLEDVRLGQPVQHHETVRVTRSGSPIDVALTVSPIRDETGEVVGASTIERDITEQRWMSATLDATLAALESALAEARASEERTRRFLADAAHQLRTPMAGIRACAETLLRGTTPGARDRLLADLVRETSRAARLISSLLQMARLDQGQPLVLQPCDLVAICGDEVERARALAPELDIRVRVLDTPREDPELDANAVREILANLLDNSRRHAVSEIELVVAVNGGVVQVTVANDGPPIPDDMVERVFERFVTLDGTKGSGLGLPIGRGLARAHGGDLVYEDEAFVLRLPATPQMADAARGS